MNAAKVTSIGQYGRLVKGRSALPALSKRPASGVGSSLVVISYLYAGRLARVGPDYSSAGFAFGCLVHSRRSRPNVRVDLWSFAPPKTSSSIRPSG